MAGLLGGHRKRYTLERLKFLYSDLLQSIDISKRELGHRGCIEDEVWSEDEIDDDVKQNQENDATSSGNHDNAFLFLALASRGLRRSLEFLPGMHRRRRRRARSPLKQLSNRWRSTTSEELAAAFRFLAATKAPDKEGDNGGAAALRDDSSVSALHAARRVEKSVVDIIREIGEVVVNGEKSLSNVKGWASNGSTLVCDPCFEYFCEKNMLSLFVDIAKQNPNNDSKSKISAQQGVVWSPLVKAQVLHTVSLLVASGARNTHSLYYILSQNAINELISCMLPLSLWTDPALEKIVPALVDLLKNLGLQLAGTPDLFPFFMRNESLPVFDAALEIGTSSYSQTDSFVHITCLSLVVSAMKIESPPVHNWVSSAIPEMQTLSNHLCQLFLNRYYRIADLSTGSIVDGIRSNAVKIQLFGLHDQINLLNDVLGCGIPGLNVRLCELFIRRVISVVLMNTLPPRERAFIRVGVSDLDVIPQRECLAQVSLMFLAQLLQHVDYLPLVRMLVVALFHSKSTPRLVNYTTKSKQSMGLLNNKDDYIFVPALDAIAQGKLADVVDNPFRRALLKTLSGDVSTYLFELHVMYISEKISDVRWLSFQYGEWRVPVAAIILETVLWSEAMDLKTLQLLGIVSNFEHNDNGKDDDAEKEEKRADDFTPDTLVYIPTEVEEALAAFLGDDSRTKLTSVSTQCLECAGSVALALFYKSQMAIIAHGYERGKVQSVSFANENGQTPVHTALVTAKTVFCKHALDSQNCLSVSNIFLELLESAVCTRYKKVASPPPSGAVRLQPHQASTYACHLSQIGCASLSCSSDLLVRKFRCVKFSDVDEARFHVKMALHFRALVKVIDKFYADLESRSSLPPSPGKGKGSNKIVLDLIDVADELALTFGGFSDKPDVSADIDLRGRMTFPCSLSDSRASERGAPSPVNKSTEETMLRHAGTLILVVDPTDMFVVRPATKSSLDRGKIVCRIPLQRVIAAASDSMWLHVAVRHPDVGRLIKNGRFGLFLILFKARLLLITRFSIILDCRKHGASIRDYWNLPYCSTIRRSS